MLEDNGVVVGAAGFVAAVMAALYGYMRKPKEPGVSVPSSVASIGLELGNRHQMDLLIDQVKRIADVLENKRQSEIEDRLDHLTELTEAALKRGSRSGGGG